MNYPASTEFYSSCFPDNENPLSSISDKINSRPTTETAFKRHHLNQSGITLRSDGSVEIRTGRDDLSTEELGSSLVLGIDGTITLIAPKGLYYSGEAVYLPGPPSEVFKFDYGSYKFNKFWEKPTIFDSNEGFGYNMPLAYRMPPETTLMAVFVPGSTTPIPVPLGLIVQSVPTTITTLAADLSDTIEAYTGVDVSAK